MIQLIVNPCSVRQSAKQVFAEIYFQFNHDLFFPEQGWDDFAVVILNWWIDNSISSCNGAESMCCFMDGSYCFNIKPENDTFNIIFISDRKGKEEVTYSERMKQKDFLKLLLSNTNIVLREIMKKHISNEDTVVLEKNYKNLQRLICTI